MHYNNVMRILNWILNILLLACATSCINRTEIIDNSHHLFVISVKDVGFTPENNQKATRAIDNGYATTFTKGDQMGLYVLDASGNVKMANLCLTYDGTNWNYPAGATLYYDDTSRKYFTYYPYQSTVVGAPTTSTATTATSFFSTLISNWTPSTDQSSQAKYTASDLMVGTGTVGALASNATRPLIFNMSLMFYITKFFRPSIKQSSRKYFLFFRHFLSIYIDSNTSFSNLLFPECPSKIKSDRDNIGLAPS